MPVAVCLLFDSLLFTIKEREGRKRRRQGNPRRVVGVFVACILYGEIRNESEAGETPAKLWKSPEKKYKKSIKNLLTKSEMFDKIESRKQAKPSESIKKEVGKVATN